MLRQTRKRSQSGGLSPLRQTYGEVILPKGTVLYHISDKEYSPNTEKPFIFLTFHPSEYIRNESQFCYRVQLRKTVSLLFMVSMIKNDRVFSLLNILFESNNLNLAKQKIHYLRCFSTELQKEKFNGWFSSIEGRTTVEVALLNTSDNYKVLQCSNVKWDWSNSRYVQDYFIRKNWGVRYPITHGPILFRIHEYYKNQIENYIKYQKEHDENGTALTVIFHFSRFIYHSGPRDTIKWTCDEQEESSPHTKGTDNRSDNII